jgi:hypothetical protein
VKNSITNEEEISKNIINYNNNNISKLVVEQRNERQEHNNKLAYDAIKSNPKKTNDNNKASKARSYYDTTANEKLHFINNAQYEENIKIIAQGYVISSYYDYLRIIYFDENSKAYNEKIHKYIVDKTKHSFSKYLIDDIIKNKKFKTSSARKSHKYKDFFHQQFDLKYAEIPTGSTNNAPPSHVEENVTIVNYKDDLKNNLLMNTNEIINQIGNNTLLVKTNIYANNDAKYIHVTPHNKADNYYSLDNATIKKNEIEARAPEYNQGITLYFTPSVEYS